jgi:23S rRNA (cytidine1920-2'-O)/16S rRNA (cytidine1409-2'-O)-methyltransferase
VTAARHPQQNEIEDQQIGATKIAGQQVKSGETAGAQAKAAGTAGAQSNAGQIARSHAEASRAPRRTKKRAVRLDDLLIERGLAADRAEALRCVLAHEVKVGDVFATSAAQKVAPDADVQVKGKKKYVSRGGLKLEGALRAFHQDVSGLRCIDIGSSTGGFSDCLLQAGAAAVACVDVNYGQLAWSVRQDPRVTVFERTNIRTADPAALGAPFDVAVADLSFIGLARLAGVFARLVGPGGVFIGLVKPQFESAHDETDHGVVRDEGVRVRTVEEVERALQAAGFAVDGVIESPITGAKGHNVEYLVRAVRTDAPTPLAFS